MLKLFSIVTRVAATMSSVLITGATGTGKELVAHTIHNQSKRSRAPFVDINCSAIPELLIESELFGHQRGTFTDAHETRRGLFESATGGTLFLDEVDALPLSAQAKLLRVLQERQVRRIGGRENIHVDVRIIAATNSDLTRAVKEGRFREDLLYRLRVVPIHVPELCNRGDDIELLVDHFLKQHALADGGPQRRFTSAAMQALKEYKWPGNVRELENTVEYAVAISMHQEMGIEDLPLNMTEQKCEAAHTVKDFNTVLGEYMKGNVSLAEIERRYILCVLEHVGGNQVRAAEALGIDRSKLYRRLKQYGVRAVRFLREEDLDGLQLRAGQLDISE
jgi:DNA-binding NtrC family response regulator